MLDNAKERANNKITNKWSFHFESKKRAHYSDEERNVMRDTKLSKYYINNLYSDFNTSAMFLSAFSSVKCKLALNLRFHI